MKKEKKSVAVNSHFFLQFGAEFPHTHFCGFISFLNTGCCPSSTRVWQVFQVLLLRRLWLPLPPTKRTCGCGRLLDSFGHHRAACANVGVLGRRGFALESAAARVCREAGARVSVNQLVRDLDFAAPRRRQSETGGGGGWPPSVSWCRSWPFFFREDEGRKSVQNQNWRKLKNQ